MDNTVGSLLQTQRSIIIGSLLGDGYVRIVPGRRDAFLEINHSFNAHKYVDWKFEMLKSIVLSPPKMRKGNGTRVAYRFFTRQHPEITDLYFQFYERHRKVIPDVLELDTLILAVWYMDDGSKCGNHDYYFNTQQFTLESQKKLQEKLEFLGIKSRLNKDKQYHRIRVLSESIPRLKFLIGPHVIPSFLYKL